MLRRLQPLAQVSLEHLCSGANTSRGDWMAAQPQIGMHRALCVLENERSMLVVNMFTGTKLRFGTFAAAVKKGFFAQVKAKAVSLTMGK